MMQALKIAATGMQGQQLNVDVLSNNISNLNTSGFKQSRAAFRDLVYQNRIAVGASTSDSGTISPSGAQFGLGVSIGAVYKIMNQGPMVNTDNSFDIGLQGRGWFAITLPSGETSYTRDGSFQLDQNGQMVTADGYALQPSITVPPGATDFTISDLGVVSARVDGSIVNLGTITLSMFTNDGGLEALGDNLFRETEASGPPVTTNANENGAGTMLQGFLEGSNVDPINSITDLITAQRAYELNSRVITTSDEMLSTIAQLT